MGLICLPQGLMLIVVRPILTSEGRGPNRGILVMGRYLDIEQIAARTHFNIALERRFTKADLPSRTTERSLPGVVAVIGWFGL